MSRPFQRRRSLLKRRCRARTLFRRLICLITGNGGVRVAEKTYEPFGPRVSTATPEFEQLEFTGHERDVPKLDYMHARYYAPEQGRFYSVDAGEGLGPPSPSELEHVCVHGEQPSEVRRSDGEYVVVPNELRAPVSQTLSEFRDVSRGV